MVSKGTLGITALVLAAGISATTGYVVAPNDTWSNKPEVRRVVDAREGLEEARSAWLSLPESERNQWTDECQEDEAYIPPSDRRDYSVPQAHSRVAQLYQDWQVADAIFRSECRQARTSPVFNEYENRTNSSFEGYMLAAIFGFGAWAFPKKRQ